MKTKEKPSSVCQLQSFKAKLFRQLNSAALSAIYVYLDKMRVSHTMHIEKTNSQYTICINWNKIELYILLIDINELGSWTLPF